MRLRGWLGRSCACLLALAVVGCSGGSDTPEPEIDVVDFDEEFSAATAAYQADMDVVQERGRSAMANDPKAVAAVFEDLIEVVDESRVRYERLVPPAAVAAPHSELVDNLRRQGEALGRVVESTSRNETDNEALQELAVLLGEFAETQQLLAERLAENG